MSLSVKSRLLVLTAAAVALVAAVGEAGLYSAAHINRANERAVATGTALRNHMECDMMHDALRGDVLAALQASTDEDRKSALQDVQEHAKLFRTSLAINDAAELDASLRKSIDDVRPLVNTYLTAAEEMVNAAVKNPGATRARFPEFMKTFSALEDKMGELSDTFQKTAEAAGADGNSTFKEGRALVLALSALSGLMLAGFAWAIIRTITRPLATTVAALERVAAGDLTAHLGMTRTDEIGKLARATDQVVDSMRQMVGEMLGVSNEVSSAATQIASSSEEMARGLTAQTQQVMQVAAAIEQMSASVIEVARQATQVTAQANGAGSTAEQGGRVVSQTIDDIRTINEAVSECSTSVGDLSKQSEQIGAIIEVIKDIADQTNLLALNAAIEAARAGEHGRGFAVVADEVRKLAERTTKATDEVGGTIRTIQTQTQDAMSRMSAGSESVKRGVERASEAGASLSQIVSASREVATMIQSIASATEQQKAASEQISSSVEQISQVTQQTSAGASQAAEASRVLADKATSLQTVVAKFKLAA